MLVLMPGAAENSPNDFSMFSLATALESAAGFLVIGNVISERYSA